MVAVRKTRETVMAQPKPTAAQALYGHLPSAVRPEVEGPRARNAAEGCWPSLSKEAKAREADQALGVSIDAWES